MSRGKRRRVNESSDEEVESPKRTQPASQIDSNVRAGRILQMTLKNFMCHSFLEVKFDGNVNFLTGNNGSGKSAILAALALGLGSRAKTTNRGNISSAKAFIKFGTNSASIEITLSNKGPQAYKPEEYGSKITVQRNMAISGGSAYKIKDAQGKIISKKMKDLVEITSALNIQVDNPVCILSQDTARNFLNATDPKMRFNLFYRATRLDNLSFLYDDAVKKKKLAHDEFALKKANEVKLMKESKKLDRKIIEAEKIEGLNVELNNLKNELIWYDVVANEKKVTKQKAVVDRLSKEAEDLEEKHETQKGIIEKMREEKRKLEGQLRELNDAQDENDKPVQELTLKIRDIERQINEKSSSIASVERQLVFKKQDLNAILKLISSYNDRVAKLEQDKQEHATSIALYETQKKEKKQLITTYEDEVNKLSTHFKDKDARVQSMQMQLQANAHKINTLNDKLSTLQKESNNPYAIYGPNYVQLMNAIESDAQNFSRPPIGPIGTQVSIKDKKWTVAVESYFKAGLLCSFIVNSQSDQHRLNQIIKRVWSKGAGGGRPPSIIATKFIDKVYDVSKNLVENTSGCVRLYDAISVPNPIVMNCLIDQTRLESVILIPDRKFALQIMKNRNNVPNNCRLALTPQADVIHPDPNYKFYSGRLQNAKFIQVDTADAARQCEDALEKEQRTRAELRTAIQAAREDLGTSGDNIPRLKQLIAKSRHEFEVIARKLHQLQAQVVETPGKIDDLREEAKELESVIKSKSGTTIETKMEIEELQNKVRDLKQDVRQFNDVRMETRKNKEDLQAKIKIMENKVQSVMHQYAKIRKTCEEFESNMKQEREILDRLQRNWKEQFDKIQREAGERPRMIRRLEEIQEEIHRVNLQLGELARYNLTELRRDLSRLHERIDVHRDTMRETEVTLMELDAAKAGRKQKLLETKKYMKEYAIFNFKNFLQCRNYQGNMTINYDTETLDMLVIPHQGVTGVTPTTNLSGGERSFSTVAFLYSLWKTLDFPFYILDEFDVYMDPQNRNLVIQILIDHAKKNKEIQYVFLTPQDISFIKDPEVSIHRLEDPKRSALTQ